jgi:hypothetical protein
MPLTTLAVHSEKGLSRISFHLLDARRQTFPTTYATPSSPSKQTAQADALWRVVSGLLNLNRKTAQSASAIVWLT